MASPPIERRCASVDAQASGLRLATATLGAGREETLGDGQPDSPGTAGHDGDATCQVVKSAEFLSIHMLSSGRPGSPCAWTQTI